MLTNRFDHFNFEPYQFHEFPKYVVHGGKDCLVKNEQEETALLATKIEYDAQNWEELKSKAKKLNLKFENDWSLEKLSACVKKTEADREYALQFADDISSNHLKNSDESLSEEDERESLFAQAQARGIHLDKRWGVDKIKTVLNSK